VTLDPSEPFLADHKIEGRPVLPAALAVEAMAELATLADPDRDVTELRNVQVLRGIVVSGDENLLVSCADVDGHSELTARLPGETAPRYRATAVSGSAAIASNDAHVGLDGLTSFPVSLQEAYARLLFHGPALAGIIAIDGICSRGMVARVRASTPRSLRRDAPPRSEWLFDPLLLDCGFQLAILWARVQLNLTPLPARVQTIRRYQASPTHELRCELVVSTGGDALLSTDFTILDADDRPVLVVAGAESALRARSERPAFANGARA
jgi:hypothetical protein